MKKEPFTVNYFPDLITQLISLIKLSPCTQGYYLSLLFVAWYISVTHNPTKTLSPFLKQFS